MLLWRKALMLWLFPPGIIIITVLLLYILLIFKKKKIATLFMVILIAFMFLFSSWLGEYLLLKPLEEKYSFRQDLSRESSDLTNRVMVVLSGGFITGNLSKDMYNTEAGEITLARLIGAYLLYKEIGCPILVSGGPIPGASGNLTAADIMEELLINLGVSPLDIIKEGHSRTTMENAVFSLELLKEYAFQEIILVTSAVHMPRAMMVFQNKKIGIVPAPVNFLYENIQPDILNIFPNRSSWEHNLRALHEWAGLLYYKIIKR